jgi:hypothetical protein
MANFDLRTFLTENKLTRVSKTLVTEDYNISKPGEVSKQYKVGQFGPEFDKWMVDTKKKAEEKDWNDWEYSFADKSNDPSQNKIIFLVSVDQFDKKEQKGTFRLDVKKGDILD